MNSRCAIAAWLECFQEKPITVSERTGLPGEESVKRFERSNGLDTALYKTIPLPVCICKYFHRLFREYSREPVAIQYLKKKIIHTWRC